MPNRLLREGMLDSARVCALPLEARWLFVTICLQADDVGLFDAAPFALMRKAELQRDLGPSLLSMLADADLIRTYRVAEKTFGFVPRFRQRLQLTKMKHPAPPRALVADDPDAFSKINRLGGFPTDAHPRTTVAQQCEAEAEAEEKRTLSEVTLPPSVAPTAAPPAPTVAKKAAKKAPTKKAVARKKPPSLEEWPIPPELRQWARVECPLVDLATETATFRDHEFATGKTDWAATWRNWIRREQKSLAAAARRQTTPSGKSFRAADGDQIASSLSKLTGGLLGRRSPSPQGEILEMQPHDAIDRD